MSSTRFHIGDALGSAPAALVVQPSIPELLFLLSILTTLGYDATVADTFRAAKGSLATTRPAFLITDVRLREFNGLHLVLRARSQWTGLPALITTSMDDLVLRMEAEQLGATFVVLPTGRDEMIAAIWRTVFRSNNLANEPIRAPFERRHTQRRTLSTSIDLPERRRTDRRRDPVSARAATVAGSSAPIRQPE